MAKSQFLSIVNHELRTLLTSILMMTNQLKHNMINFDNKQRLMVENIIHFSIDLLNIVNNILDFTKPESGVWEINFAILSS